MNISSHVITPFHMLLEATFLPKLLQGNVAQFSAHEDAEANDALARRACRWTHLTYVWAVENGQIDLRNTFGRSPREHITIDQSNFFIALGEIQTEFEIEFSIPFLPGETDAVRESYGQMELTAEDELHIVGRSNWFPIDFTPLLREEDGNVPEIADEGIPDNLPVFAQPILAWPDVTLGEVWVRFSEASVNLLKNSMADTVDSMVILSRARADLLRTLLPRRQEQLAEDHLHAINVHLRASTEVATLLTDVVGRARAFASVEEGREFIAGLFQEFNGLGVAKTPNISEQITVFLSYSHEDEKHKKAIRRHLALLEREARIEVWDDRDMTPGTDFDPEIFAALDRSSVITLACEQRLPCFRLLLRERVTQSDGKALASGRGCHPCRAACMRLAVISDKDSFGRPY